MNLNITYRLRMNKEDKILLKRLRELRINPSVFVRNAMREKIKKELPLLIKEEEKRKSKEYCPF